MTKKILFALIFSFVFMTAANAQSLSGSIGNGIIRRGGAAKATVVLNIPNGVHTNSSRPNSEYSVPTSVKISSAGVKLGTVMYPRGKNKKFEFSDEPLNVYEHRAAFYFIIAVPKNYKGNIIKVSAIIDYQACTTEVCYPPKKQEIVLTAKVR
ncbi:MAG: protein-disulfide reductase DsbD domain-containing protein [Pyrinomonadaceae bacterium]